MKTQIIIPVLVVRIDADYFYKFQCVLCGTGINVKMDSETNKKKHKCQCGYEWKFEAVAWGEK